jgi:hypothetical protein
MRQPHGICLLASLEYTLSLPALSMAVTAK